MEKTIYQAFQCLSFVLIKHTLKIQIVIIIELWCKKEAEGNFMLALDKTFSLHSFDVKGLFFPLIQSVVKQNLVGISVISRLPVHLSMLSWSSFNCYSTLHNILSKALAAFPFNHCRNNGQQ